ncbi:MAG TPA: sigma-70 family RNA polymerase sigma factor [Burkholderiales bacterium]|nr:sigma-70 family RNA polymerase sigma factor [Burkholderiales bacterium]
MERETRFEETVMAHLDAAYNLARWLTRDDHDADDVVQEACLRAFRFYASFHGGNARAWLLAIVRNTYYTWLDKNRVQTSNVEFTDDTVAAVDYDLATTADSVERLLQEDDTRQLVRRALERIPAEFREVIVLRELEGLSYKEVAAVAGVPVGTVMSRLARARRRLEAVLSPQLQEEA